MLQARCSRLMLCQHAPDRCTQGPTTAASNKHTTHICIVLQVPRKAWPGLLRMPDLAGCAGSAEAVEAFVTLVRR